MTMNLLKKTQARRLVAWSLSMMAGLLASCGGGGGGSAPTLSGEVRGLAPQGALVMAVNGATQSFTTSVFVPSIPLSFSRAFSPGENYTIAVQKHPAGQICAVLRGASGRLDASVANVLVECHTTRLNDTGIQAAIPSGMTALAPDSRHGRDAEAARLTKVGSGAFGFDFTKVCSSGDLVDPQGGCPSGATSACVRDNVTGLMWRSSDIAYTGADSVPAASESLCGRNNWRVPTVHELLSIVHSGQSTAPFADTDFFAFGSADRVFLSSESYRIGAGLSWAVDFNNAGAAGAYNTAGVEQRRARWVSGTSALDDPPSAAYTRTDVDPNYVIIDTRRELMWLVPKTLSQGTWAAAVDGVATINGAAPGGYVDWRLPNRSELDALVNRSRDRPAMDPVVSAAIPNSNDASVIYWTSSSSVLNSDFAWVIDFSFGDISPKAKSDSARLIYVRNRAFNNAQ
jgi:Protein of unknown function (DUF1566)